MPRTPVMQRILRRTEIDPDTGCWRWPGATTPRTNRGGGYGVVQTWNGSRWVADYVHRVVYQELVGTIKNTIDHVEAVGCSHKDCHNPDHLEDVTQHVNNLRAYASGARKARG